MDRSYQKALELDKLLLMLSEYALCEDTKRRALSIEPQCEVEEVKYALEQTDAMLKLVLRFGEPRISGIESVLPAVDRAAKGGVLNLGELLSVCRLLKNLRILRQWYGQQEEELSVLDDLFYAVTPQPALEKQLTESILSETELADSASDTLYEIRRKIKKTENAIREKLEAIVRTPNTQKYLQESVVALRDGRFVVPVKAEHRGEIGGVIHDVSSSGSTLFVEPTAVAEANAKILQLRNMEKEEIERILEAFSAQIASLEAVLRQSHEGLLQADLLLAKAKLAIRQNANKPQLSYTMDFSLIRARHPLIPKEQVVPIDIALGKEYDTLVVTGPNTGGKTVALKTAGLLCDMVRYGLLIPADERSVVCVFSKFLVDIGDEQSIEQSLSTFSGHIRNITRIIAEADARSLVLMDELGAGTDPAEGAALAVAIIEWLRQSKARIMATTHYGEMKIFALETAGVQNASCEFDVESLRPTYKLSIGVPGKSNAFLISEKLGLSKDVLDGAKQRLSQENVRFEQVLNQLEDLKLQLKSGEAEMERLRGEAARQLENARKKQLELEAQGHAELEAAREKARRVTTEVQNEAYHLMDELKALRRQQELTLQQKAQRAREIAKKESEKLYQQAVSPEEKTVHTPLSEVKKGDCVFIFSLGTEGIVLGGPDKKGRVEIQAGALKTRVPLSGLGAAAVQKKSAPQPYGRKPGASRMEEQPKRGASMEINLLGMTVDEAVLEADRFIDSAVRNGLHQVYLIHGKGTGALRRGLHEHLKTQRSVKSYRLGVYGEGENGVTVVELK